MRKSIQRQGPMLAALMAVLTLAGCAQLEIADRAVAYNKAVEDASNRMLVLNIIRAKKRYPLYFTDFTKISGDVPLSGTFSLSIPFGGDGASNFVFSPQSTVKSGISFDMVVQNKQEFMLGIITPVSLDTYDFYFRQGRPKATLFHVFVREIELRNGMREKIDTAFKLACENNRKAGVTDLLCELAEKEEIQGKPCKIKIAAANKDNDPYVNAPPNICRFLRFQNLYWKLRVLDAEFKIVPNPKAKVIKTTTTQVGGLMTTEKDKKPVIIWTPKLKAETTETKPGGSDAVCLSVREDVKNLFSPIKGSPCDDTPSADDAEKGEAANDKAKNDKAKNSKAKNGNAKPAKRKEPSITLKLRSPESMIYYLGEVTRVQNRKHEEDTPRYVPKVIFGPEKSRAKGPLFQLIKGSPGPEGATVTVSHEGETYYIPREKYGSSMGVLTLISTILATHKKGKELPTTPSVRIIGG